MRRPSNGFRDTLLYVMSILAAAGIVGAVKMYADLNVAKATTDAISARVDGCENTSADLVRQLQQQWVDLERIKGLHELQERERMREQNREGQR